MPFAYHHRRKPRARSAVRYAATFAALAMALAGCSEPSAVERQDGSGVITWVRTDEFGGFAHQVSGVVTAGEGGCLQVQLDDEDRPLVAVWPRDSHLSDDGAYVELPSGERLAVGDRIAGTAGVLSVGRGNDYDAIKEVCHALSFVEWTEAAPAE